MFRRRRSFRRFSSRFKRSRRSLYPHQGGRWSRAQFCFINGHASSNGFSDITWSDILQIPFHLGDPNVIIGDQLNSFARHIEVRAIRANVSGLYIPNLTTVNGVFLDNQVFAGIALDNFDRSSTATPGVPLASVLFDPFVTTRPLKSTLSANTDADQDTAQPVRWLKREWHLFNGGNIASSSSAFTSTGAQFNRNLNVARRFRLDDFTGLYFVSAFRSSAEEGAAVAYDLQWAGAIWYRVSFGR